MGSKWGQGCPEAKNRYWDIEIPSWCQDRTHQFWPSLLELFWKPIDTQNVVKHHFGSSLKDKLCSYDFLHLSLGKSPFGLLGRLSECMLYDCWLHVSIPTRLGKEESNSPDLEDQALGRWWWWWGNQTERSRNFTRLCTTIKEVCG